MTLSKKDFFFEAINVRLHSMTMSLIYIKTAILFLQVLEAFLFLPINIKNGFPHSLSVVGTSIEILKPSHEVEPAETKTEVRYFWLRHLSQSALVSRGFLFSISFLLSHSFMSGLYYQQAKVKKPDVYGIKKRLVKKLQKEDGEDEFPVDDILSLESDTVSAAEYLTSREKTSSGLCLLHQIYSILTNNTTVDRELVRLQT